MIRDWLQVKVQPGVGGESGSWRSRGNPAALVTKADLWMGSNDECRWVGGRKESFEVWGKSRTPCQADVPPGSNFGDQTEVDAAMMSQRPPEAAPSGWLPAAAGVPQWHVPSIPSILCLMCLHSLSKYYSVLLAFLKQRHDHTCSPLAQANESRVCVCPSVFHGEHVPTWRESQNATGRAGL